MTDQKKDNMVKWVTDLTLADLLKVSAMFAIFFRMGIIWSSFTTSYNTMSDNIVNIKQDVIEIKADRAVLRSNITMLNDSLSSYEQRRAKFYYSRN